MAGWFVRLFRGVAPKNEPRLLQDNQAQIAQNCKLWHGSLRPMTTNQLIPGVLDKPGDIETIYRFGKDFSADDRCWLHWASDVDVCRGAIAEDASEKTYYTDGVLPKVTDKSIALVGGIAYPMASYTLGVPPPMTACTVEISGSGSGLSETRVYAYTYVTAWGEEGKPSPPSAPINVLPGQSVDVSDLLPAPDGDYNITAKRIYRSSSGGMFFVKEVPIATEATNDAVLSEALGESIPSTHYAMPPADLRGLVSMPNGMMAGFSGKSVYFCQPYQPHAWPLAYVYPVANDIVALGVVDTTLVVLTTAAPCLLQGVSPDSMSMVEAGIQQACVAKRSVATMGSHVVYASPDGLFAIGGGEPINLTEAYFTNREWQDFFDPDTDRFMWSMLGSPPVWGDGETPMWASPGVNAFHGYVLDNRYIGFYRKESGDSGGFILDPKKGDVTTLGWYASAGYYDPRRDALFLVVDGELVKFEAAETVLTATWRSKLFYSPRPINLGAIRVEASGYPITVKVYADGVLTMTYNLTSKNASRMKAGFLANTWEFEIITNNEVFSVAFAESIGGLVSG